MGLGDASVPKTPPEVAVGIPADLVRRRPDVRKAEREAAAQSARIGIAEVRFLSADFDYRHIGLVVSGLDEPVCAGIVSRRRRPWRSIGTSSTTAALSTMSGRRTRDSSRRLTPTRRKCWRPAREAEDGIVKFLKSHQRSKCLDASAQAAENTRVITMDQYRQGVVDFTAVLHRRVRVVAGAGSGGRSPRPDRPESDRIVPGPGRRLGDAIVAARRGGRARRGRVATLPDRAAEFHSLHRARSAQPTRAQRLSFNHVPSDFCFPPHASNCSRRCHEGLSVCCLRRPAAIVRFSGFRRRRSHDLRKALLFHVPLLLPAADHLCPDDYCRKPFPCIPCLRPCCECDDYCRKPMPCVRCLPRCGRAMTTAASLGPASVGRRRRPSLRAVVSLLRE